MKRIIYTAAILLLSITGFCQADTTKPNEPDTIRAGNFLIIKKNKSYKKADTDTLEKKNYSIDITIGDE